MKLFLRMSCDIFKVYQIPQENPRGFEACKPTRDAVQCDNQVNQFTHNRRFVNENLA